MATALTIIELRKMPSADLTREAEARRSEIAGLRMGIELRKEKNTAKYRTAKRELARMLTVLAEKTVTDETPKKEPSAAKKASRKTSTPSRS